MTDAPFVDATATPSGVADAPLVSDGPTIWWGPKPYDPADEPMPVHPLKAQVEEIEMEAGWFSLEEEG